MKIQGIILAGGKSRRFGEDKAFAKWKGITLLEHAERILKKLYLESCIIINETQNYSFLKCRTEQDLIPGKGPLGGLYTACRIFENTSLLVLTCDMPEVTLESLLTLMSSHQVKNKITVFRHPEGFLQPFPGLYEPALSHTLFERMNKDQLSMIDFLESIPEKKVIATQNQKPFLNVNSKKELFQANSRLTGQWSEP
ncbi:MAG: molybdenum cofactor guanylyltransferase [Chlamydiae bacterium]|nr:molybdenum cofactor guanylyltransferase [Chlamydiota bacterium]MBI3277138.1 molybdenum cofactor guanylyltransferase [Chlamydiota bacterium]